MFFFLFFFCNEYVFLWLFSGIFLSLPLSLSLFFLSEQKRYELVCFGNLGVKIVGFFIVVTFSVTVIGFGIFS